VADSEWAVTHGTHDMWRRCCIMATSSPVYLFKHVKHDTQNIQNDFNQWPSGSFRVRQLRFRPALHPGSHWGSLQRSPDPLVGLRRPTSKGRGRERRAKGKDWERGEERKGRELGDRPPFANSWIRPWFSCVENIVIGQVHPLFLRVIPRGTLPR